MGNNLIKSQEKGEQDQTSGEHLFVMLDEMNGQCSSLPARNTQEKADRQTFGGKAGKTIAATTSALYHAFPCAFLKVSQESQVWTMFLSVSELRAGTVLP